MKKISFLLTMLFLMLTGTTANAAELTPTSCTTPSGSNMNPGKERILTCPFCGTKKSVMTLRSGNTIGAIYWSDNKCNAPMLPQISYIQRCPYCQKFYLPSRQEEVLGDNTSFELGTLTYEETKLALKQIKNFNDSIEEFHVLVFYIQAYNDTYSRGTYDKKTRTYTTPHKTAPATEVKYFKSIVQRLMKLTTSWTDEPNSKTLKAEYLREAGLFSEALKTLPKESDCTEEYLKRIVKQERTRCQKRNTDVFIIE